MKAKAGKRNAEKIKQFLLKLLLVRSFTTSEMLTFAGVALLTGRTMLNDALNTIHIRATMQITCNRHQARENACAQGTISCWVLLLIG